MKWLSNNIFEIVFGIFVVLAIFILVNVLISVAERDLAANDFADKNGCYIIGKLTNDNHKYIMACKEQLIVRRFL